MSTETIRLIMVMEKEMRGEDMSSSFKRSDPQRPKRPSATVRTTMLRRLGPRQ